MVFKATNGASGVEINGVKTQIVNLTGKKAESTGVVFIEGGAHIYVPDQAPDFDAILNLLKDLVTSLAAVSLQPNPSYTQTITDLTLNINQIKENLK